MEDRFKDHPGGRDRSQLRENFVLENFAPGAYADNSSLKQAFFPKKPGTGIQEIEEGGRVTAYGGVSFASGQACFSKIPVI